MERILEDVPEGHGSRREPVEEEGLKLSFGKVSCYENEGESLELRRCWE